MKIKNLLFKNAGLRIMAMILALFVWAMITGRERSYSEKTLDVNVEYYGMARNIDIRNVNPDKVRIKIQGAANELDKISPDEFKLRIDLQRITESTRLNVFTEDNLEYPPNIRILSIYPRMIEITTVELLQRDIPVKIRYTGQLRPGIRIVDRKISPEKVEVLGYKTQIANIQAVDTVEAINLDEIVETRKIMLRLKKDKEILKFVYNDIIEVYLLVENSNSEKEQ
jgi:YbbR domain-containing protein